MTQSAVDAMTEHLYELENINQQITDLETRSQNNRECLEQFKMDDYRDKKIFLADAWCNFGDFFIKTPPPTIRRMVMLEQRTIQNEITTLRKQQTESTQRFSMLYPDATLNTLTN